MVDLVVSRSRPPPRQLKKQMEVMKQERRRQTTWDEIQKSSMDKQEREAGNMVQLGAALCPVKRLEGTKWDQGNCIDG